MDFYFRESELEELSVLHKQSLESSKMAVLLGRRRIGKTSLALKFVEKKKHIYLFVAKKSEALLCESYTEEIKSKLKLSLHGKLETFKEIFSVLIDYAKEHRLTVIIDEFQEFYNINPSVYSDIQCLWDLNKNQTKMNVIFIGSVYSLMHKIFENEKEPLFGRADRIFRLRPFSIQQLRLILNEYGVSDLKRLFEFYVITGGVPKYLDILLSNKCYTLNKILDFMLKENSPFLHEGRHQLIEEFGKEYTNYFSILELIARGKTASSEIQSVIHKNVSAYLDKLENNYSIIQKFKPINGKPNSKLLKYTIVDNFLKFWFRFFHRNRDSIEIHNYDFIKDIIKRDFDSYSGRLLEKFFFELLADSKKYNRMGSYWERGHINEIDIVAINDMEKTITLIEVKKNKRRNSQARLEHRSEKLLRDYPGYEVEYLRLSLEDAEHFLDE